MKKKNCRFLNKACVKNEEECGWRVCSWEKVEQVKILISVMPIFGCTIIFNTILAQLQTFSVQQASSMNTHLSKSFHIPPASLQSIPYLLLLLLVPLYDALARRRPNLITPLRRIGAGLLVATFSMIAAALVERKRRNADQILPVWWLAPQFVIFGVSEMLTAVGLVEFFYKQPLPSQGMRASLTAITYCSYSFGFFLSSMLVSLVNSVTARASAAGAGWLTDNNLNNDRLDLFYWLLALLSFLNFLNYLFWSNWYSIGFKHGGSGDNVV